MSGKEKQDQKSVEKEEIPVIEEEESPAEEEEIPVEEASEEEEESDDSADEETPFWMQDDDEEEEAEEPPDASGQVSEAALISVKKKLKGRLQEKDEELTNLRKEIDELKKKIGEGTPLTQSGLQPPKRPRRSDFEADEEYEDALDKYDEARLTFHSKVTTTQAQRQQELEEKKKRLETAVDSHYDRAAKLVTTSGIDQDVFKASDEAVQNVLQKVHPKYGKVLFGQIVDLVGEGSEKTLFYVGRNKKALAEFEHVLLSDKSGLSAAFHLGKLAERIVDPKKPRSRAAKPAKRVQGDASTNAKEQVALRKYRDAHKSGDAQKAYNIKKQARKDGLNVSNW